MTGTYTRWLEWRRTTLRTMQTPWMAYLAGRQHALLDAHALCTTTTDAAALARLIEADR